MSPKTVNGFTDEESEVLAKIAEMPKPARITALVKKAVNAR